MEKDNALTVLVVDDEQDIRELLVMIVEASRNVRVVVASNGQQAIELLNTQPEIELVICDYRMPLANGGDVFRAMNQLGSPAPFILVSADPPEAFAEFNDKKPYASVLKPDVVKPLGILVRDLLSKVSTLNDYCRIKIDTLLRLQFLVTDVYLNLGGRHFVKVMNEGENFEQRDFERFREKGVEYLYFIPEHAEKLLANLEKNLVAIGEAKNVDPLELAESVLVPSMELVRDLSKTFGWDESLQRVVNENVNMTVKALARVSDFASLLKLMLSQRRKGLANYAATVSYVSCGIVQSLGWVSDLTAYKMTMAALLEDLSLTDAEFAQMAELEKRASDPAAQASAEVKSFREHPKVAARLLEKWKNAPPDVDVIVLEHHEIPDGSGFPFGRNYAGISPLAAVQIVARDIVGYYEEKGAQADINEFLGLRANLYTHGVFKKIFQALALVIVSDGK